MEKELIKPEEKLPATTEEIVSLVEKISINIHVSLNMSDNGRAYHCHNKLVGVQSQIDVMKKRMSNFGEKFNLAITDMSRISNLILHCLELNDMGRAYACHNMLTDVLYKLNIIKKYIKEIKTESV